MFDIYSMRKLLKQLYKLLCCQKLITATASTRVPLHMLLTSFRDCKTWVAEYDHITPHLMELCWLKIKECIVYKVCVLMYKCIKGLAPQYLSEVVIQVHGRNLRSTTLNNLPTVRCNTAIVHNSAFSSTGPRLWNMLPNDIKTSSNLDVFKTRLKSFLFSLSYD